MRKNFRWILTAALLLGAAPRFCAGASIRLEASPESRIWLEGNSSLHPFSSTAAVVKAGLSIEADAETPGSELNALLSAHPVRLTVAIPVSGLKSAHAGLDKNLRKALKADKYADIVFLLERYAAKAGKVTASGTLSIAGETRPVDLAASLAASRPGLVIEGEQPILMTDFGIKPPTMMLGAIKTDDRVLVKFRLELVPEDAGIQRQGESK